LSRRGLKPIKPVYDPDRPDGRLNITASAFNQLDQYTSSPGRSKAEPKIFAPPQTPFRGRGTAKIKSAGDGHYLYLQTQFGEDRCTQFRVTHTARPSATDRGDCNTLLRSSARSVMMGLPGGQNDFKIVLTV